MPLLYSLEFKPLQNTYDEYSAIFVTFDKDSTILQSYEKLTNTHGITHLQNDKAALKAKNRALQRH